MSYWPYIESIIRFISKRQSGNEVITEIVENVGLDHGLIEPGDPVPSEVVSGYEKMLSSVVQEAESQGVEPSKFIKTIFTSRQSKYYIEESGGEYWVTDESGNALHNNGYSNYDDARQYQKALYVNTEDV